jgi:transposase
VEWARKTGRYAALLFQQILDRYPHPEMGYRSCLGLLRLGEKYGSKRLESACERALVTGAASYKSVKSILAHALDSQPCPEGTQAETNPPPSAGHDNIRGAGYYE